MVLTAAADRPAILGGNRAITLDGAAANQWPIITDEDVDCDVLVFGDDKAARAEVIGLALQMGLRGLHGGALVNAAAAEALTSVLIFLNKAYQVDGAGIRITGTLIDPTD